MTAAIVERIFRTHHAQLLGQLRRWSPSAVPATLEDAAAFAFMQLLRKPDEWLDESRVAAWLYIVARNEALHQFSAPTPIELPPPATASEERFDERIAAREVLAAVGRLPVRQRAALVGRMAGLSYDEIGARAGHPTTPGVRANTWANRHLHEGRRTLAAVLA